MHETNENTPEANLDPVQERLERVEDTLLGILVQLSRIYDVLAAQAADTSNAGLIEILDGHDQGIIYSSAPSLVSFDGQQMDQGETHVENL